MASLGAATAYALSAAEVAHEANEQCLQHCGNSLGQSFNCAGFCGFARLGNEHNALVAGQLARVSNIPVARRLLSFAMRDAVAHQWKTKQSEAETMGWFVEHLEEMLENVVGREL